MAYNQGKRSIVVNLKEPSGRDAALRLIERADVVIESSRPGALEKLGLGPDDALRVNPQVIYASVSAFGRSGPERSRGGVDMVIQAESGIMSVTGEAGGDPLKVGFQVVDVATGHVLAQAILAALLGRERGQGGQVLEVALVEVAMHLQAGTFAEYLATGVLPVRTGNSAPQTAQADLFDTADGQMVMTGYLDPHWKALCEMVGRPDLHDDPRFRTKLDRVLNRDELDEILQGAFLTRTTQEWLVALGSEGLPVGEVKSYADIVASPRVAARGSIVDVAGPDGSTHRAVRLPARFATWDADPSSRPPVVGEHTCEILAELGLSDAEVDDLLASGAVAGLAPNRPALPVTE